MNNESEAKSRFDDGMTFVGILIGLVIGAIVTLFQLSQRGEVTRKDIAYFGAGSIEEDITLSLEEAKNQAKSRQEADS